jgi:hypothetical protein
LLFSAQQKSRNSFLLRLFYFLPDLAFGFAGRPEHFLLDRDFLANSVFDFAERWAYFFVGRIASSNSLTVSVFGSVTFAGSTSALLSAPAPITRKGKA